MKYFFLIIIIASVLHPIYAQEHDNQLTLLVSSRVDTSSIDVKSIIKLYENYYQSRPDSIYDNPYWNTKEKQLYKDFDFSRKSIFHGGMNVHTLFQYFNPFVMSVEPIGEKYAIRVLFSSNTTNPLYAGSKVWCIQKLHAIKENEKWVFENVLVELTKEWRSTQNGMIEYVYPPQHIFDNETSDKAVTFCKRIMQRFNPNFNDSIKYYITSSIDDMGLLENFDYYFAGITTGKAREGMILTSKGSAHFPHEFVHKLLPTNPNRGLVIEEGLAEFLGTKEDPEAYRNRMNKLATDLKHNSEKINFKSVVSQSMTFNGYQTAYPAGAGICELVYKLNGDNGLKQLMHANTIGYTDIVKTVCAITNLTESQLETEWNKIMNTYFNQP